jgi:hypothetical protein
MDVEMRDGLAPSNSIIDSNVEPGWLVQPVD